MRSGQLKLNLSFFLASRSKRGFVFGLCGGGSAASLTEDFWGVFLESSCWISLIKSYKILSGKQRRTEQETRVWESRTSDGLKRKPGDLSRRPKESCRFIFTIKSMNKGKMCQGRWEGNENERRAMEESSCEFGDGDVANEEEAGHFQYDRTRWSWDLKRDL